VSVCAEWWAEFGGEDQGRTYSRMLSELVKLAISSGESRIPEKRIFKARH